MSTALMLDTSYLITLVDDTRAHHAAAKQYFKHSLEQGVPLHVSTLALAEFATRQAVTDLPLNSFRIEPFNIQHAVRCGQLWANLMPARDPDDSRVVVKADVQLIAQATVEGIPLLVTEDANSLSKYAERARKGGLTLCQTILLAKGFDETWFNQGQRGLDLPVAAGDQSAR